MFAYLMTEAFLKENQLKRLTSPISVLNAEYLLELLCKWHSLRIIIPYQHTYKRHWRIYFMTDTTQTILS